MRSAMTRREALHYYVRIKARLCLLGVKVLIYISGNIVSWSLAETPVLPLHAPLL